MEFKKIDRPVRAGTWMIMRSYGEKWDGSMLNVEVWSNGTLLARQDIEGYHDKKTSETYNIKMRLDGEGWCSCRERSKNQLCIDRWESLQNIRYGHYLRPLIRIN